MYQILNINGIASRCFDGLTDADLFYAQENQRLDKSFPSTSIEGFIALQPALNRVYS
jgi:hypothetical protein